MTLPTLVHKHNKKVIETRLKKFYSTMNQAVLMSEVENGDKKEWAGISKIQKENADCLADPNSEACVTYFYNKYLEKYIKTAKKKRYTNTPNKGLCVFFADGSAVIISYAGGDYWFYPKANKISDPDSKVGKDYFGFTMQAAGTSHTESRELVYNKGIEPYVAMSWDGTREGLINNHNNLTKLIQLNNWEIPDDYPIKL